MRRLGNLNLACFDSKNAVPWLVYDEANIKSFQTAVATFHGDNPLPTQKQPWNLQKIARKGTFNWKTAELFIFRIICRI